MDQCLDLSIITVFSIKVSISRDGSLKGKLSRKFAFKLKSSQELMFVDFEVIRVPMLFNPSL